MCAGMLYCLRRIVFRATLYLSHVFTFPLLHKPVVDAFDCCPDMTEAANCLREFTAVAFVNL